MSNDQILDAVKYEERVKSLLRRGWFYDGANDLWRLGMDAYSFEQACKKEYL